MRIGLYGVACKENIHMSILHYHSDRMIVPRQISEMISIEIEGSVAMSSQIQLTVRLLFDCFCERAKESLR
jgi:hypothetical protein